MAYEQPDTYDESDDTLSSEVAKAISEDKMDGLVDQQTDVELIRLRARDRARERYEEEQHEGNAYSWVAVDHDAAFAMQQQRPMPTIGHMTETPNSPPLPLFYEGKINGVHGDSEAGKSWLCQWVCVQEIQQSHHVLYVDFEDDAGGVYGRLLSLGASEDRIRTYFHYVNPTSKLTTFERVSFAQLVSMEVNRKTLAVIDGVTEAMALENLTGRDEGEVARWHQIVTKPLADAGWGVVMIDHMPHGEQRVIGSQHKRSAITGVSYMLESIGSFAPGQAGRSRLRVDKDRPGWIRGEAAPGQRPQWYGDFVLDATLSYLQPSIWPWKRDDPSEDKAYESEPPQDVSLAVWQFVKNNPGMTGKVIRTAVKGKEAHIEWALEWLVDHEWLSAEPGQRRAITYMIAADFEGARAPVNGSRGRGETEQASEQGVLDE